MSTLTVDCPVCTCKLQFNAAHHGRPGLCHECRTALIIPANVASGGSDDGATRVMDAQSVQIKRAQALAKAAVKAQRLDRREAERFYKHFVRRQRRGERGITLEGILIEEGVLTPAQSKELVSQLNREDPGRKKQQKGPEDTECPNCFETINRDAKTCRFCGQYLAKMELLVACANCSVEHPKEDVYCSACSAEIRTGLMRGMSRIRCPKCGNMSQGMEEVCVVCKTPLKLGREEVQFNELVGKAQNLLYASKGWLGLIVAVWLAFWLYGNWKPLWYGDEFLLRAQVESFQTALSHKDFQALAGLIRTEDGKPEPSAVKKRWLALTGLPDDKTDLEEIRVDEVKISGDRASVYITVSYAPKLDLGSLDPTKLAGGSEKAAGKLLKATRNKKIEVKLVWRFENRRDEWVYVSPF